MLEQDNKFGNRPIIVNNINQVGTSHFSELLWQKKTISQMVNC